jgi:hypothetical protein
MQENLAQLSSSLSLPADQFKHIKVLSSTAEKFGVDFVPEELDQLAAKAAEEEGLMQPLFLGAGRCGGPEG